MFGCKIVLDSVSPDGVRIASVAATYPRFIHAELMTHRDRARNAASSRAIPWKRKRKDNPTLYVDNCMYQMVMSDPVIPIYLGREQAGMQAGAELEGEDRAAAIDIIMDMRNYCVAGVDKLAALGLHKSICNRYVEPWMWITTLMTATEWKNFFRLRCHPKAERHFSFIANMVKDALRESQPQCLNYGEWHLPYINRDVDIPAIEVAYKQGKFDDINWTMEDILKRVSAGRCARLSYLTHEGIRDIMEDVKLCERLISHKDDAGVVDDDVMHASPLEHPAECVAWNSISGYFRSGPYRGWKQFRKEFPNENVMG